MKTPYSTASIPDNSLSREAFEKSLPQGFSLKRIHSINGNGAYHNSTVHTKWISWQAALNSRVDVEALRSFAESMMTLPETAQYAHIHAVKLGAASALGLPYSIPEADALMECGLSVCSTTILDELRTDNDKLREANRVLVAALKDAIYNMKGWEESMEWAGYTNFSKEMREEISALGKALALASGEVAI